MATRSRAGTSWPLPSSTGMGSRSMDESTASLSRCACDNLSLPWRILSDSQQSQLGSGYRLRPVGKTHSASLGRRSSALRRASSLPHLDPVERLLRGAFDQFDTTATALTT